MALRRMRRGFVAAAEGGQQHRPRHRAHARPRSMPATTLRESTVGFWLVSFHIAAMTVWFAGLFLLPRLFIARDRDEADSDAAFFNIAANTLYFRLMTPAAVATIAAGIALIALGPPGGAWLVLKLVLVAAAVLVHLQFGLTLYALGHGGRRRHAWMHRLLGAAPLVLLLALAALTGAKPVLEDAFALHSPAGSESSPASSAGSPSP
ncbi:CopD family protein [Arenimonas composti]|uniref:CopD family protein n=1 Tax=Arenimonas composti TaxID=370776 RepID=UPI001FEDD150|nr:CopD family protein [Arenimonas composti]